ncbi:MAG: restriction endonuclease subunit S [Salinivirgaceae bacterium]|nr:restriction endonuclease subunit S [Salinivirgaceae bacterium]
MKNNNTKPFSKTTIPSDWEEMKLGKIAKVTSGGTPSREKKTFWEGNIPWITTSLIDFNEIDIAEEYITEEGLENSSTKLFPIGTLLMALYGQGVTRGKTAMLNIEATTNQACAAIILDENIVDNRYVFQYLIHKYESIRNLSNTGNQENLNGEIVKSIKLNIPPLPEQRAIAKALSLMDTAINKNNQLIAQKELRKKWLMQNLLTGKKRLKGFIGEWKEMKLGKLFTEIKSVNDGADGHSIMTISSKRGLISQEDKFDRVIAGDSLKKYTQLKRDDFAYNKGNSKTYPMGCIYKLEEFESALVPFVYICFTPTNLVDSKFYKQWFLAYGLDRQLKKIITSGARGDGLLNVNKSDFFNLKTIYPPKEEQIAIAQVLQAADKEIELLKTKTEKLREQKKGMMQVLLTGKKRLKLDIN